MKLGFHSPLPPLKTGVADYAAHLLTALRRYAEIDVNPVRHDGPALYHLGNNQLHRSIYNRAIEQPGVVVLHDAVLQHFFLGSLSEEEYVAEFTDNYGSWSELLARQLWLNRAGSGADARYFEYPMLRRIAQRSRGIIVHNHAAALAVLQHEPSARVFEIPHFFEPPPEPAAYAVEQLRGALGVDRRTALFGVFGYLRESKRLTAVLRAFGQVRETARAALLIAGDFVSRDLERALAPALSAPGILRASYLPERDFWRHAAAVDACINLRYPAAGESSGIGVRLMGIGKPVLLTRGPEVENFPEHACVRIDPGLPETGMLTHAMAWLARYPADAEALGRNAKAWIASRHSMDRVAQLYWQALTDCYHERFRDPSCSRA